jgi:hypothetical protein
MKGRKHGRQQMTACHGWLHRLGCTPCQLTQKSIVVVVLPQQAEEVAAEKNRAIVAARNADIRCASTVAN